MCKSYQSPLMKKRLFLKASLLVLALILVLPGCATPNYGDYKLDLRSAKVPVMLNKSFTTEIGRKFKAVFTKSVVSSTSTYGNVQVTTTSTRETAVPMDFQIISKLLPDDDLIVLTGIGLFHHIMMAPYYGENQILMFLDVTYLMR